METWKRELYSRTICHYGVSKRDGAKFGSGRYPLGSGERPRAEQTVKNHTNNFGMPSVVDEDFKPNHGLTAAKLVGAIGLMTATALLTPALASSGYIFVALKLGLMGTSASALIAKQAIDDSAARRNKTKVDKEIKENKNVDKKSGLKLKTKEMDEKEDLAKVNPGFKTYKNSVTHNCHSCVLAYDLRRRGYDVTAETFTSGGKTSSEILKNYKNGESSFKYAKDISSSSPESRTKAQIQNMISDGGSGIIFVNWQNGGGHVMNYTIDNGKLVILDGQSNRIYDGKKAEDLLLTRTMNTPFNGYARTDNLEFDFDNLKKDRSVKYEGKYKR